MITLFLRKAVRCSAVSLIFAGLLGAATLAGAASNDTGKHPARQATKTHSARHSKSAARKRAKAPSHKAPERGISHQDAGAGPSPSSPTDSTSNGAIRVGPAPVSGTRPIPRNSTAVRTHSIPAVIGGHNSRKSVSVHDNLGGGQRVVVERRDGSRLVAELGRPGYVQRSYKFNGHEFARRSYYSHGLEYQSFYRAYSYRGLQFNLYSPGFYYTRGFYGWVYNPWPKPITFAWNWAGSPWLVHYGYYFAPYPDYPSAAFWLTDYMISQDLQASYAANQEAGEENGTPPPSDSATRPPVLTTEIKKRIAIEVKDQLALENQEAAQTAANQEVSPGSSGIARLLSDNRPHVFVAGGNLDVTGTSGQPCVISDGDALEMQSQPAADATAVDLVVLSSKGKPECEISDTVKVQLTELQEMENHMRETIDRGLKILQDKQGTDGLPSAPPSAQAQPMQPQYAAVALPADPKDVADIQQQEQQTNQAVGVVSLDGSQASPSQPAATPASAGSTDVPAANAPPTAIPSTVPADAAATPTPAATAQAGVDGTPAPPTIELGQTIDQVEAVLGAPTRIAHQKSGTVFYYNGKNITFKDGKVTKVE